jgi:hypothetical protein
MSDLAEVDVQAWTTEVNFGTEIGVHTLLLCRFMADGPLYVQLSDVGDAFKLIPLYRIEMRENAKRLQAYRSESRPEVLAELKRRGFVASTVARVEVITISAAHQHLKDPELGVPAHAVDVMETLASSEPPPRPPAPPPRPPAPVQRRENWGGANHATC